MAACSSRGLAIDDPAVPATDFFQANIFQYINPKKDIVSIKEKRREKVIPEPGVASFLRFSFIEIEHFYFLRATMIMRGDFLTSYLPNW